MLFAELLLILILPSMILSLEPSIHVSLFGVVGVLIFSSSLEEIASLSFAL